MVSVDPHFQVSLFHLSYAGRSCSCYKSKKGRYTVSAPFLQRHSLRLHLESLAGLQRGFPSGTSFLEVSENQKKQGLGGGTMSLVRLQVLSNTSAGLELRSRVKKPGCVLPHPFL